MEKQRKLTNFFRKRESAEEASEVTDEAMVNTIMSADSTEDPMPSTSSSDFDGRSSVAKGGASPADDSFPDAEEVHQRKKQRLVFNPMDIGNFMTGDRMLSDEQRYDGLVNCWKPEEDYVFPKIAETERVRAFQHGYLKTWPWLAYTEMHGGGAVCKPCILFAKAESSKQGGHRFLGS